MPRRRHRLWFQGLGSLSVEPQLTAATAVGGRSVTCIALVLTAALVACGDDSVQDTTTSTSTQPTSTTAVSCEATVQPPVVDDDEIFINIDVPQDGQEFTDRRVRFEGTTQPGAIVRAGQFQDFADDGTWCFDLTLQVDAGPQPVLFTAQDAAGTQDSDTVEVIYIPPPSTTTTSEPSP